MKIVRYIFMFVASLVLMTRGVFADTTIFSSGTTIIQKASCSTGWTDVGSIKDTTTADVSCGSFSCRICSLDADIVIASSTGTTRSVQQWIDEFNNADLFPMMNKLFVVIFYYICILGSLWFGLVYGFRFFSTKKKD